MDELHLLVYPLTLGTGKRVWPAEGLRAEFTLRAATPYATGVVGLDYVGHGAAYARRS